MSMLPVSSFSIYNRSLLLDSLPELAIQHKQMKKITTIGGAFSILASFLLLGSFIVLFSSIICIFVIGAGDIVSCFVLPIFLPVGIVLVLCIPMIIVMVKKHRAKKILQNKIAETNLKLIYNELLFPVQKGKKELALFIRDQLFFIDRNKFYKKEIIENIKEKLPKKVKRTEQDNLILEVLDKVSGYVLMPKESQREDDREEREIAAKKSAEKPEIITEVLDSSLTDVESVSSDDQELPIDNLARIAVLQQEIVIHIEEQVED